MRGRVGDDVPAHDDAGVVVVDVQVVAEDVRAGTGHVLVPAVVIEDVLLDQETVDRIGVQTLRVSADGVDGVGIHDHRAPQAEVGVTTAVALEDDVAAVAFELAVLDQDVRARLQELRADAIAAAAVQVGVEVHADECQIVDRRGRTAAAVGPDAALGPSLEQRTRRRAAEGRDQHRLAR